ncbi:MAG: COX15/CtaA family protein [Planctomycetaceae bacterium]
MTSANDTPWLHRLAVLTACAALLPIVMGALVTTTDAGMAFRDWPTSDGHGMLSYPWWQSVGDKFLEHGHRLAGIVIGLASMALCVGCALLDRRTWVRWLGLAVLLAVVAQGLLGGQRVRLDARGLAFVHGSFAALVFGLMAAVAVVTSRAWREARPATRVASANRLRALSIVTVLCLFVQYVLGGLVRHRGMALHEHLGFAFVAALFTVWLSLAAMASAARWLQAPAAALAGLTIVQLALGAGAWVTRFGFGDYVAVYRSNVQIAFRTAHVLTGMLLFASAVVLTVRIMRVAWLQKTTGGPAPDRVAQGSPLTFAGGVS